MVAFIIAVRGMPVHRAAGFRGLLLPGAITPLVPCLQLKEFVRS